MIFSRTVAAHACHPRACARARAFYRVRVLSRSESSAPARRAVCSELPDVWRLRIAGLGRGFASRACVAHAAAHTYSGVHSHPTASSLYTRVQAVRFLHHCCSLSQPLGDDDKLGCVLPSRRNLLLWPAMLREVAQKSCTEHRGQMQVKKQRSRFQACGFSLDG
eukprot:2784259-Rhodomonas_salina.1